MKTSPDFSSHNLSRPNQLIDMSLFKQNLKSPIKQQSLINKYLPEHQTIHKCLPPKFYPHPIFGQLLIKFQSIVFLSHVPVSKSKHLIYRCRMLGYTPEETPFLSNNITYTIHTNNKMFKHYLKDMKVCLVEVLDARNYEPIGHSYINWLTYIKSTQDNELITEKDENPNKYDQGSKLLKRYYLPFLDEQCFITLPLFDYRNIKSLARSPQQNSQIQGLSLGVKGSGKERIIGEIQLKFMSRIYEHPIGPGYAAFGSQSNYGVESEFPHQNGQFQPFDNQNEVKGNVVPSYLQIPYANRASNTIPSNKNMISLKSLVPSSKMSQNPQQRVDSLGSESSHISPQTLQLRRQPSNHSIFNLQKHSSKIAYHNSYKIDGIGCKLYSRQDQQKSNHRSSYDTNKTQVRKQTSKTNEVELLQLKLDVEQFFKIERLVKLIPKRQEKVLLQITKLKTKLLNINNLDVIFNENEEQFMAQNKQSPFSKPHIKIYKVSSDKHKNQQFFNSKLVVQRPTQRIIEIQLPNNQGKCVFRCKDLTAPTNDICLYNKGVIVGVLSIKKQTQKKEIPSTPNVSSSKDKNKTIIQSNSLPTEPGKLLKDKICIVVIENFMQNIHKKSDLNQLSNQDNYTISIKNIQFVHQSLKNSKNTGQYAITNCQSFPKTFAIQAKNSYNQFVGMSENINFQGNQVTLADQNIMPTLILEKNLSITFKQMPVFKKLPNSVSFRFSIYIANTNQLNYFINKWKQKVQKLKNLQVRKERCISNTRHIVGKHTEKVNTQKVKERQYTISDQVSESKNKENQRVRTESENKNSINVNYRNIESKTYGVRESENERFKTQGNYTEDLNNQILLGNIRSQSKQNDEQYSQKQGDEEQQIYLVEFFCKSLHHVLSCLGSKKIIQSKITELNNYHYTNKSVQTQQSKSISQDHSILPYPKGLVSKQQFSRILSLLIGQNSEANLEVLGFDVNQILQALFVSEDGNFIKMQQFTLCLMAYYNFLLLLNNQKITAIKQVILCQPQSESKLSKIQNSMTNINFEFLWDDVLSNVIEKTKQKICKRYRIYPNTPFSVNLLLKDLKLVKKNIMDSNDQSFFKNLLDIMAASEQKNYELFMKTTADLGSLVRQTVEEIIFTQCLKSSSVNKDKIWIGDALKKIEQFVRGQNMDSIESESKNENVLSLNLTQFQELFSKIGIETSTWQSLMLIEEIKVWYEGDETRDKQLFEGGEGIIAIKLVRSWLNGLKTKIQMRNELRNVRGQLNTKSSRHNSVKSLDSDEEDIIEQMNKKKPQMPYEKYQNPKDLLNQHQKRQQYNNQAPNKRFQDIKYNGSELHLKNQKNLMRKENPSIKQSQTMNNESDIANIANLLRQNDNNLYFLPSITDPRSIHKINSANNILSDQNILRGIDETSLRNPVDLLPHKIIKNQPKKQPQIFQLQSDSSQINQSEASRVSEMKRHTESAPVFVSVQIKQLTLKRKEVVLQKEGLKKISLSFKTKQMKSYKQSLQKHGANHDNFEYYFISQELLTKILSNQKSLSQPLSKYQISNMKVDMNNLNQFQTLYSQGFCLQLINLSTPPQSTQANKKSFNEFDKLEEVLFTGILPIQDIAKVIQDFKSKISPQLLEDQQKQQAQSKKKTIVLYCGREIIGKAVAQVTVSNRPTSHLQDNLSQQRLKMTKIRCSISRQQLSNNKSKSLAQYDAKQPFLMSLWCCSVRNQQKTTQILPMISENTIHQLQLPEPVIQHQLIVRNLQSDNQDEPNYENNKFQGSNLSQISRFTQIEKLPYHNQLQQSNGQRQYQIKQGKYQGVVPLETLYFKKSIDETYPLIDKESGRFVCSINVQLQIIKSDNLLNPREERKVQYSLAEESQFNDT